MTKLAQVDIRASVINIVNELAPERLSEALEFVLFLKAQQIKQTQTSPTQPIQRLEELWSDFWPEDESTEEFIDTVRRWRREDALLHRDLSDEPGSS